MKKLLIIEDDRIILETTTEYLKEEGYEILKALDGEIGIEMATRLLPDLILCDIYMPKFDGYQVYKKLQSIPSTYQIPFIFLTAKSEKEDIRFGMELGVDDYITKPIDFIALTKSIQVRLEKYNRTIRASEMHYRTLFELASDAILLVKPSTGEIIDANQACSLILGYMKNELLNLSVPDIFSSPASEMIIGKGTADHLPLPVSNLESGWRTKQGNIIPVLVNGKQYSLNENINLLLIVRDITELKNKENELLRSEQRYHEIVDLTNDWIWEINPKWEYTYVSPKVTEILGFTSEELIGKTPFDFLEEEEKQKFQEYLRAFVHEYKPLNNLETWVTHKNGKSVCLQTSAMPFFDTDGSYLGYRGADRDITIRKSVEQQLIQAKLKAEESDRLKSSILSNMSHELRTPLNGILGFSEILRKELHDTTFIPMVENIHISGFRLMQTLNSLITLSQLEAGKMAPVNREVNLKELVNQVVRSMEVLLQEKQDTAVIENIPDITICTDEYLLKHLLHQLLDNAIKFTEKGFIRVESENIHNENGEWLLLHIRDSGIGIEKSYYDMIFQEFRQVSEGFGRKYQGSGIGLTICKKIIDLIGGKITLESNPGKGSTFSVHIPWISKAPAAVKGTPKKLTVKVKEPTNTDSLPLVLLVEDNVVNRDLTAYFLKDTCLLDFAEDGLTAIEYARRNKYAVILMDINLGAGISGIEATREIRKLPGYKKTPIIAVTGYTMIEDQQKMISEGCSHYLAKPFDRTTLVALMIQVLSSREK